MSLIEQAAKRLEELRRAGIDIPDRPGQGTDNPRPTFGDRLGSIAPTASSLPAKPSGISVGIEPRLDGSSDQCFELDLAMLAANGFATPDMPRSQIADEFRIIKRTLIGNALGKRVTPIKNSNLIMVTSALPNEGKTFSAVNLAMSIAMELDRTVLLVDADVARPALPKLLGLPPGKGLLDILDGSVGDLSQVLIKTSVEKLSILPSGTHHQQATELLASAQMTHLLDEMAIRYPDRIIVFDSPPLLVTTEARVLATHMGQIAFVVNAETTLQRDVILALATIESCPVKMMILNKAKSASMGLYSYGYQAYGT